MRKIFFVATMATIMFVGCENKHDVAPTVNSEVSRLGRLGDENVLIPEGVDPSAVQIFSRDEAMRYIATAFGGSSKGGRVAAIDELDPTTVSLLLLEKAKNYPAFDFSLKELPDDQFARIRKDFPDIKTQEQAYNKRETISLYYENRLRYDLISAVKAKESPTTPGARVKALLGIDNLPGGWGWLATAYPLACNHALNAKGQVDDAANAFFPGGNIDGERSNAFRHSGWCGLVARKNIAAGQSKDTGVNGASVVCSSFECVSVNFDPSQAGSIYMVFTQDINAAMDLYNNSIGRSYIWNNTTFGLFGVRKSFPSEGYFLDTMRDRACVQNSFLPTVSSDTQILGYVHPDPNVAWEILYRNFVSNWYSFVRRADSQLCN